MRGTAKSGDLVFDLEIQRTAKANRRLARLRKEEENTIAENNDERQKTLREYTTPIADSYATSIVRPPM